MQSETPDGIADTARGGTAIRRWTAKAVDKANRWARSPLVRIRPRVSLVTGSVLVLLTLYLPVAYTACGSPKNGYEVLKKDWIWPGVLTFLFDWSERGLYLLALGFAVATLLFVLISCLRPESLRKRALITWFFAIAGTFSLWVTSDFFWVLFGMSVGDFPKRLVGGEEVLVAGVAGVTVLVLASCLRSRLLRRQKWLTLLFGMTGAGSLIVIGDFFSSHFYSSRLVGGDTALLLMMAPSTLYWVAPAWLWYRFGLSRQTELRVQWVGIRSRIISMYGPLAVFDVFFLGRVVKDGVWGFVPFFIGIHLISLGYMQLARDAVHPLRAEAITSPPS